MVPEFWGWIEEEYGYPSYSLLFLCCTNLKEPKNLKEILIGAAQTDSYLIYINEWTNLSYIYSLNTFLIMLKLFNLSTWRTTD